MGAQSVQRLRAQSLFTLHLSLVLKALLRNHPKACMIFPFAIDRCFILACFLQCTHSFLLRKEIAEQHFLHSSFMKLCPRHSNSHEPTSMKHQIISLLLEHIDDLSNEERSFWVIWMNEDVVTGVHLFLTNKSRVIIAPGSLHIDWITEPVHCRLKN